MKAVVIIRKRRSPLPPEPVAPIGPVALRNGAPIELEREDRIRGARFDEKAGEPIASEVFAAFKRKAA